MYITMQGNWTVSVKTKAAAFPQRFTISGASTGNGTHAGVTGSAPVHVTGSLWTINIQNNPGSGFQNSDTRLKFPTIVGGNIVFDIESNDAGTDQDFDDLVLTCSTPNTANDYIMYGNVSCYSGRCYFNPCILNWVVIESQEALEASLKNSVLAHAIKELYPERIPPIIVNPNPPDPGPFRPLMINLASNSQAVERVANVYEKLAAEQPVTSKKALAAENEKTIAPQFKLTRSVSVSAGAGVKAMTYDLSTIAGIKAEVRNFCTKKPLPFITLSFAEYDRTPAELSGAPYSGNGNRNPLGTAITDMNGNYIFRFTQSVFELVNEVFNDVAAGENVFVAYRPDVIVSVPNSTPGGSALYESVPHRNIPNFYHANLCFPCNSIPETAHCFNGNLIGGLGDVEIGGTQNTTGSLADPALDRNAYGNHLHHDGTVSVQVFPNQAGFHATSACWVGTIDLKGCMYNTQRQPNDPIISHYTIRYKKPGGAWQFVNEPYKHNIFRSTNPPTYTGDPVGPVPLTLHVDSIATPNVPAYINIQKEIFHDGIAWEFTDMDRFMQLHSSIYEADVPGTVYFMVEGYDSAGNLVPGAKDLIALFIDNSGVKCTLDDLSFTADGVNVIKGDCNLYKMKDAYLDSPLHITFKANDLKGFVERYDLAFNKCGASFAINESIPGISSGINPATVDTNSYAPYRGTAELSKFGDANSHMIDYTPKLPNTKWLEPNETYTMLFVSLGMSKRQTNGYNSGVGYYPAGGSVIAVERLP